MDHALVVGCDAYPNSPGADLRGAVADALAVREWLLGPGGVPEANVTCLLSPSGGGLQPPDGVAAGAASVVQFGKAVARLSRVAAGPGDRLFVYFAGHGLRTDPFNPVVAHDALLLHDFDREVPQPGAVGVQDLLSRLELTAFGEVVVVLDACRNFPFPEPFRLGGLGFDGPAAAGTTARIYLLQATEPGSTARGHAVDGVVRGDLTLAVVDALNGVGAAKHFDETAARPYVVDWAGLTRYVEAAVPDQGSRPRGDGNPVLVAFPDDAFGTVALTVEVDPDTARTDPLLQVRVAYDDPRRPAEQQVTGAGPAPVRLNVPQRRHRVIASLGERWDRRAVDVYADTTVRLTVDGPGPASLRQFTPELMVKGGPAEGALRVVADDPFAPMELRTLSGRTVASAVGDLAAIVPAGQYTAAAFDDAAREHLQPVEVLASNEATVAVRLPGPELTAVRHALRHRDADPRRQAVVCVVTEPGGLVPDLPYLGDDQYARTLQDPPDWVTVSLAGHTLRVPLAPGAIAVLTARQAPLSAAFYDLADLAEERATLPLDRAQRLYAAGRRRAAAQVLRAARTGPGPSPVRAAFAEALGAPPADGAMRHALAARTDPDERAFLLPAEPWAVFLDRPDPT
ncbi:hypothetical protein GCM10022255_079570 [Dactylosporangium darangshiense]|uniref:Peptidase C14 caspase domain-containing protein n=1 Tax=Dactylosporangium darangshiense TaxID=579108 RepID=A0ABP8DL01_9ACTN